MNTKEIERIRKINANKAHGHIDSAVSHCAFLLNYIDVLSQQNSDGEQKSRTDTLAMLVRRLSRALRKHEPDAEVLQQARQYLISIGQAGTPFRAEEAEGAETSVRHETNKG